MKPDELSAMLSWLFSLFASFTYHINSFVFIYTCLRIIECVFRAKIPSAPDDEPAVRQRLPERQGPDPLQGGEPSELAEPGLAPEVRMDLDAGHLRSQAARSACPHADHLRKPAAGQAACPHADHLRKPAAGQACLHVGHSQQPALRHPPLKEWGREIVINLSICHHPQPTLPVRKKSSSKRFDTNDGLFTCGLFLFTGTFLFYFPVRGEPGLVTTLGTPIPDLPAETESPYHQDWQTYLKEYERHLEKAQEPPPSEAEVANLQLLWTGSTPSAFEGLIALGDGVWAPQDMSFQAEVMESLNNQSSGGESNRTKRDNSPFLFDAYDCSNPVTIEDVGHSITTNCAAEVKTGFTTVNASYQLLQVERTRAAQGYTCQAVMTQTNSYCGVYDHQTKNDRDEVYNIPYYISPTDCRTMHQLKKFIDPKGRVHDLIEGSPNRVQYFLKGRSYLDGGELKCIGEQYFFRDALQGSRCGVHTPAAHPDEGRLHVRERPHHSANNADSFTLSTTARRVQYGHHHVPLDSPKYAR
ncbi:unnamed protein product [Sphagnum tenellum]